MKVGNKTHEGIEVVAVASIFAKRSAKHGKQLTVLLKGDSVFMDTEHALIQELKNLNDVLEPFIKQVSIEMYGK